MNPILFKKLTEYAKQTSVSQLENVKKRNLIKWLAISQDELQLFLDELHQQRLMEYKFNCICSGCGEPITVYENEYISGKIIECRRCGMERLMETLIDKGEVLYVFNKQEILNYHEDVKQTNSSLLERSKIGRQGKIIEIKPQYIEKENDGSMKIFIGSSKEQVQNMKRVALQLEGLGHEVMRWDKPGLFTLGKYTFENLGRVSRDVNAAIFILGEDDNIWYRNEFTTQPRDNVLLEYGLFAGVLGKEKVIIAKSGEPKLASDLAGITFLDLSRGDSTIQTELEEWISSLNE